MCAHAYSVDHCHVNVFICVLNFRGWSQPRKYFNSEIFLIYSKLLLLQHMTRCSIFNFAQTSLYWSMLYALTQATHSYVLLVMMHIMWCTSWVFDQNR